MLGKPGEASFPGVCKHHGAAKLGTGLGLCSGAPRRRVLFRTIATVFESSPDLKTRYPSDAHKTLVLSSSPGVDMTFVRADLLQMNGLSPGQHLWDRVSR